MAALRESPVSAPQCAAIYVRVSTAGQEQDGTSLVTQEQRCRAFAAARGWIVADEHVYVEVHSGAYLWERPQLTRLRAAMRGGAFDVVLCYAIDRLSREQDHLGLIVSEAQHYGCRLAGVTEDWDNSPLGKFLRSATAFAGELERAKILERTSRGKRARVAAGKPLPGKRAPYGYSWNADRTAWVINEPEAEIVRRIFAEIAAGETLHGMAAKLTREGVSIPWPTARNRCFWAHGTIRNICLTPAYWGQPSAYRWQDQFRQERDPRTGEMRTRKSVVERPRDQQIALSTDVVPPLVDPALAQEAAARLAHNRRYVRRPALHLDALLHGGHGVCGLCGGPLMVRRERRGPPRYHCRRKHEKHAYPCQSHTMSAPMLDGAVWAKVQRALRNPDLITHEIERRQSPDTASADIAMIDQRLAEIACEQSNLAYAVAKVPNQRAAEPLVAQLTRLDEERTKLEADRESVTARAIAWQAHHDRMTSFAQRCRAVGDRVDQLNMSERRDALYALGLKVELFPKDHNPRWQIVGEIDLDALGVEADADVPDIYGVIGTTMVRLMPGCTRHRMW